MKENKNGNVKQNTNINEDIASVGEFLLKPFTISKQKLNKLNDIKVSGLLAIILSIMATILTLFKTIINTSREVSYWNDEVTWNFDNIADINFIKEIGGNFLIYIGIILAISGIYYIGSLIIKKEIKFPRMLGITSITIIPALACILILAPVLSFIYIPLGIGITIVGILYTILVLNEIISNEISLKGNLKLYFNLIVISILLMIVSYIGIDSLINTISDNINNIFS